MVKIVPMGGSKGKKQQSRQRKPQKEKAVRRNIPKPAKASSKGVKRNLNNRPTQNTSGVVRRNTNSTQRTSSGAVIRRNQGGRQESRGPLLPDFGIIETAKDILWRHPYAQAVRKVVGAGVLAGMIGLPVFTYVAKEIDKGEFTLEKIENQVAATPIFDRNNEPLRTVYSGVKKQRKLTFDQIPPPLRNGWQAVEDAGFPDHNGIEYLALPKAAVRSARTGRLQSGSTITQQTAKQLMFGREGRPGNRKDESKYLKPFYKLYGKIREFSKALALEEIIARDLAQEQGISEDQLDEHPEIKPQVKKKILELYCNAFDLARANAIGCGLGWKYHFNEEITDYTRPLNNEEKIEYERITGVKDIRKIRKGGIVANLEDEELMRVYRHALGQIDFNKITKQEFSSGKDKSLLEKIYEISQGKINEDALHYLLKCVYFTRAVKGPNDYNWVTRSKNRSREYITGKINEAMHHATKRLVVRNHISKDTRELALEFYKNISLDDFFEAGDVLNTAPKSNPILIEILTSPRFAELREEHDIYLLDDIVAKNWSIKATLDGEYQKANKHKIIETASWMHTYLDGFHTAPKPKSNPVVLLEPGEIYRAKVIRKVRNKKNKIQKLEVEINNVKGYIDRASIMSLALANAGRKYGAARESEIEKLLAKITSEQESKKGVEYVSVTFQKETRKGELKFNLQSYAPRVSPFAIVMNANGEILSMQGSWNSTDTNQTKTYNKSGSRLKPFQVYERVRDLEQLHIGLDDPIRCLIAPIFQRTSEKGKGKKNVKKLYYAPNDMHFSQSICTQRQLVTQSENVATIWLAANQFNHMDPGERQKEMLKYGILQRSAEEQDEFENRLEDIMDTFVTLQNNSDRNFYGQLKRSMDKLGIERQIGDSLELYIERVEVKKTESDKEEAEKINKKQKELQKGRTKKLIKKLDLELKRYGVSQAKGESSDAFIDRLEGAVIAYNAFEKTGDYQDKLQKEMATFGIHPKKEESKNAFRERLRKMGVLVYRNTKGNYFLDKVDLGFIAETRAKEVFRQRTDLTGTERELLLLMDFGYGYKENHIENPKYEYEGPVQKAQKDFNRSRRAPKDLAKLIEKYNVLSFNYLSLVEKRKDVERTLDKMRAHEGASDLEGRIFLRETDGAKPEVVIYSKAGRVLTDKTRNKVSGKKEMPYLQGSLPTVEEQEALGLTQISLSALMTKYSTAELADLLNGDNISIDGRINLAFFKELEETYNEQWELIKDYNKSNALSPDILNDHPALKVRLAMQKFIIGTLEKEHGVKVNPATLSSPNPSILPPIDAPSTLLGEAEYLTPEQEAQILIQILSGKRVVPHEVDEINDKDGNAVWKFEDPNLPVIHKRPNLAKRIYQILLGPTYAGTATSVNGVRFKENGEITRRGTTRLGNIPYEVGLKTGTSQNHHTVGNYAVAAFAKDGEAELTTEELIVIADGITNYRRAGQHIPRGMKDLTSGNSVPLLIEIMKIEYENREHELIDTLDEGENSLGLNTAEDADEQVYAFTGSYKADGQKIIETGRIAKLGECQNQPYIKDPLPRYAHCIDKKGHMRKLIRVDKYRSR